MIVDDEEFCISAMKAMLKILGIDSEHHVDFCIDGQEALNKLVDTYDAGMSYKIIFTDFKMPIMDGIDATEHMRRILTEDYNLKREDQPRIIGVTGHVLNSYKKKGLKAGMDDILPKPLYIDELNKVLSMHKLIQKQSTHQII